MATLVARKPLNMKAAVGVIDSDALIESAGDISADANEVFLDLGPAGGLAVDFNANVGSSSLSVQFKRFALHVGDELTPVKWVLSGVSLSVSGSFEVNPDTVEFSVTIPGFWHASGAIGRYPPYDLSFHEDYLGNGTFGEHIFRQGDTITGSPGSDNLFGFGGNDTMSGSGGSDRLNGGSGVDKINGGAGNDTISWGTGDIVNGANGEDTLKVTSGSLNLLLVPEGRIVNVEKIDLSGGDDSTLTLNKREVLDLSSTTNILTVLGDAGDRVDLAAGFALDSTAGGFDIWKNGAATVRIETELDVL